MALQCGAMSGNTIGKLFTVTSYGESHGPAIGCVVDGCPPGMALGEADLQEDLDRRKPGKSRHTTQRRETDEVRILSGVFEGRTTGTPIHLMIENMDQRSRDYSKIADQFRPAHADYTYQQKYGLRDYRGGGRSSARETAMRVAAGAIAKKYLPETPGIQVRGYLPSWARSALRASDWDEVNQQPLLLSRCGTRCRNWRPTWTLCARRATPSARASTWWPPGFRRGWASPSSIAWTRISPTPS